MMCRWSIQWQFRVELRKKRPAGRRYCNIFEACNRAIGVRIEGKSCSHSIERELTGLHDWIWERRKSGGWLWDLEAKWFKRTVETAETDMVSKGVVCVGEDTFVFRHVDFEMMADYPSEMIQQLADDKRMKLSKWMRFLMEVHHFTYEIFLPKNQLESDHTSTVYWKLRWVVGWMC